MRRSVPPERVHEAEQQRAAMTAATRVQGVLVPPGTATVILSFDGPVDVPALRDALGRMIDSGDLNGLSVEVDEPAPRALATGGVIDTPGVIIAGDDGCAPLPHFDGPTTSEAFEEATRGFHEHALAVQARTAERLAPAFALIAQAAGAPDHGEGNAPSTPLEHLRAHGPATAAQTAAALGITPQKAARELTELVRDARAVKDGKAYAATGVSAAPAEA